jgi:hypothetical protein
MDDSIVEFLIVKKNNFHKYNDYVYNKELDFVLVPLRTRLDKTYERKPN